MAPAQAHPQPALTAAEEADLVARLRAGDERAFEALVDRHYAMMLAVARGYVRTRSVAEEVVQEAWLGVLNGIDRFEGRSSLKTWIMRIVVNIAISRGEREARSIPFSSFASEGDEPAVDPDRFRDEGEGFRGHWRGIPRQLGLAAGRRAARPRDAGGHQEGDRRPATGAAGRDHDARRGRLQPRGGLRRARCVRWQPARASAPRPLPCAQRAREASGWLSRTIISAARRSSSW